MIEGEEDFQPALNNLKEQFKLLKSELKTKNDQLSEYNNQLILIKERHPHYLNEIDVLQSNQEQEEEKLRDRVKQLQAELPQLNQRFNSELSKHNDEIARLQDEVKVLSDVAKTNKNLDTTTDETLEDNSFLENEVQEVFNDFCLKEKYAEQLEEENTKLCENISCLRLELEQVKESVECKKQELIEAYNLMNTFQEDALMCKTKLNCLKNNLIKQEDENSLFAEVNDRRLKLQETLLSLIDNCNKMKQEISKKQKQIFTLRLHNDELQSLLKNDPLECEQNYKLQSDTYVSRISTLEYLFEDYKKLLKEKQTLTTNGLPSNTVDFLKHVTELHRKNEEKLNVAVGMEFRAQKMLSIQLKEIKLKIHEWKAVVEQLQTKLLQTEESIQILKLQSNNPKTNPKTEIDESSNQNSTNEEVYEDERKFVAKHEKENSPENANTDEINCLPAEKKVTFAANTADSKSSNGMGVRKGRKVLQCKAVYIPSLAK